MDDDGAREMSLDELAARAAVTPRTVRFYIAQGLLPGPGTRGKSAAYGAEHLTRLRLIRLLGEQHVPLAHIRSLLAGLAPDELREMLAREEARTGELRRAEREGSPKAYLTKLLEGAREARKPRPVYPSYPAQKAPAADSLPLSEPRTRKLLNEQAPAARRPGEMWRRWVLAPGVELHVRLDAETRSRGLIERLLAEAGADDDPGMQDNDGGQETRD